jgi:NAD(P)H-quinone oxidoreductase subunit I
MAMEGELFRSLREKPVTLLFPHERAEPVEGIRAKVTWEIEKCIGCNLCVRICPSRAIELTGKGREAEITYDVGRCIFCGECVDICPTKAIYATKEFELAFTRPRQMIIEFKRPKEKPKPSSNE